MCKLQSIHQESFAKYGQVLEFGRNCDESFEIKVTEERQPWRIAVFRYSNKTIQRMENHPYSMESFEPLSGITVLVVALHDNPGEYEAFILDKPICLKKGIWHQTLALTKEAQVKITENLDVCSEFYDFDTSIGVIVE